MKSEIITNINPKMLEWARNQCKYTIEEVKKRFPKIEKWEKSKEFPTLIQLRELASYYKKPVVIFCFQVLPEEQTDIDVRSFNIIINSKLMKLINWVKYMQFNLIELYNGNNPNISSLEQIRQYLRDLNYEKIRELIGIDYNYILNEIKNPNDCFEYHRDLFFKIGIHVYKQSVNLDEVSGLCLNNKNFPIILINNKEARQRQIFTLYHELYHILIEHNYVSLRSEFEKSEFEKTEYECNNFAANILVPDNLFIKYVENEEINMNLIESIASQFKLSREVINRKLKDNNLLTFEQYNDFKNYIKKGDELNKKKKKSGGDYYRNQKIYLGVHYIRKVVNSYKNDKITDVQLVNYLLMKYSNINKLLRNDFSYV